MLVINVRNVNYALTEGIRLIGECGVLEQSRNGSVLRASCPVATVYGKPEERVLFHSWRDANPFFHLVESFQYLSGRNFLKDLLPYVSRMKEYSDDGKTQPGSYGYRWRRWFKAAPNSNQTSNCLDQLDWAVRRLKSNSTDRRVVISMWDGHADPHAADGGSKDVPCNLQIMPWISQGKFHITVTNRSNDAIWGAYGANAVHFSFLQEYLAARLNLPLGTYTQFSNNLHIYTEGPAPVSPNWEWGIDARGNLRGDPYANNAVTPLPAFRDFWAKEGDDRAERIFKEDLLIFFEHGWREAATKARLPFIRQVLAPMCAAHEHYRKTTGEDRYLGALEIINQVTASDWKRAAWEWIGRRLDKFQKAKDDGVIHEL